MDAREYRAVIGRVASADSAGMWLNCSSGDEVRATVPNANGLARPGHDVAVVGIESAQGYTATLLVNRSTRETWAMHPHLELSWSQSLKRAILPPHTGWLLLMLIPLLNLAVASYLGLVALVSALTARCFLRTLGVLLLWVACTFGIAAALLSGSHGGLKGAMMWWYFLAFPLSYPVVTASIERSIDRNRARLTSRMRQALEHAAEQERLGRGATSATTAR